MSSNIYDCIIVGGGASAIHAAFPLVEMGLNVLMLDGGIESKDNIHILASSNFDSIRKEMSDQHKLFLGTDVSGAIPASKHNQADHMTSGRFSFITEKTNDFLPVHTGGFSFTQTLAKGGMTEIWGGASDVLDEDELRAIGLPASEMHTHYQIIIDRVGISGYLKNYKTQKPAQVSTHSQKILDVFERKKNYFNVSGMSLHQSVLALLTEDKGGRKSSTYNDSDYWNDDGKSLYRARFTLEDLEKKENFSYVPYRVVTHVQESSGSVKVCSMDFSFNVHEYESKYVIVSAGAINTVKILLKTFGMYDQKVKITSKPNIITPCVDLRFLGKTEDSKKHSLCQLVLENNNKVKGFVSSYSQMYKYKSLLLFKLLKFFPMTKPESLSLLSLLMPSMFIVDSRFPSVVNNYKTCELKKKDGTDILDIVYNTSQEELLFMQKQIKLVKKTLRRLGLFPLVDVYMKEGTSAHYAGGVSTIDDEEAPLKANQNGKVVGTQRIFVGDASLWKALSAKPPTLTIMANANRIGTHVASVIASE